MSSFLWVGDSDDVETPAGVGHHALDGQVVGRRRGQIRTDADLYIGFLVPILPSDLGFVNGLLLSQP